MTTAIATKDKPIIFSGPMVRAILEDRKNMTRRVIVPQPVVLQKPGNEPWALYIEHKGEDFYAWSTFIERYCPYQVGQKLWVREIWATDKINDELAPCELPDYAPTYYLADAPFPESFDPGRTRASIHLPRRFSRLTLEVTGIRAERLQEITEEDAIAEGFQGHRYHDVEHYRFGEHTARHEFREYWNTLHAKPKPMFIGSEIHHYVSYPWEDIQEIRTYRGKPWYVYGNPWNWPISFKKITSPA